MRRILLILVLLACPRLALAFDCAGPGFSAGQPRINLRHILCGEFHNGKPDGYHSEMMHQTRWVIGVRDRRPVRNTSGVYSATVLFVNGATKFSTFYPQKCGQTQIENSIRYAVAQPQTPKPNNWGFIAPSAPREGGLAYCTGADGRPIVIRYALGDRGDVQTAFPDER